MRDDSEIKSVKLQCAFNSLPSCYISSFTDAIISVHSRFLNTHHNGILATMDEDDVCESSRGKRPAVGVLLKLLCNVCSVGRR
jgi:hypothetical protein